MKRLGMILLVLTALTLLTEVVWASTTITVPVIRSTDDHEEQSIGDQSADGIASQDLDLGEKRVGVRFDYVQVPQGAVINRAYLVFTAGSPVETPALTANLELSIQGEDQDWARTFKEEDDNIKDRYDDDPTSAKVTWNMTTNWTNLEKVSPPDVTAIVQELTDRSGWSMGNPMVFILSQVSGSKRTVYAKDNTINTDYDPKLVIEYTPAACTADVRISQSSDDVYRDDGSNYLTESYVKVANKPAGLRFQNVPIPQGVDITSAYLDLTAAALSDQSSGGAIDIYGQAADNAATFTSGENFTDRITTGTKIDWNGIGKWGTVGQKQRSPDISSIIEQITGRNGWSSGNALVMLLDEDNKSRRFVAYDEATTGPKAAALLHVEWDCPTIPVNAPTISVDVTSSPSIYLGATAYLGSDAAADSFVITNTGTADLNFTLSGSATYPWISLSALTGTLAPGAATTINVTYDTDTLSVGTYAFNLQVVDTNASNNPVVIPVSLTVSEVPLTDRSCNNVPLYVQNRPNPAVLIELDLSGSMTSNSMPVYDGGAVPQTPELRTIVQEIVDRINWQSGNQMGFLITGTGTRRAYSFDGNSGFAPELRVSFSYLAADGITTVNETIEVPVANSRDDAVQSGSGLTTNGTSLTLGNSQTVGLLFRNITIPKGATVNAATILLSPSNTDSSATSLTITGDDQDNAGEFTTNTSGLDVFERTATTASVAWNTTTTPALTAWTAPTMKTRLAIGQSVIKDIVKNRNIAWGFGSWKESYGAGIDYTKIHSGCRTNTDIHLAELTAAIDSVGSGGTTPFVPSMRAALAYFNGTKADLTTPTAVSFPTLSCQDKFLIEVTDGEGNLDSTVAGAETAAGNLADAGVSAVAVGFGITSAAQINKVAEIANTRGKASDTDGIYALHDEVASVGVPFFANNQAELLTALNSISRKIENRFTGSAPAPTTSADDNDLMMVLIAEFGSASWTGDVRAVTYNPATKAWISEEWVATQEMPAKADRNVWTAASGSKVPYDASTLAGDNFLCKETDSGGSGLGDIIDSAPKIVKAPNSFYSFDGYSTFYNQKRSRRPMFYIGANDGMLHAFTLTDKKDTDGTTILEHGGKEKWAFMPPSMQAKMNLAVSDPTMDMCSQDYCHQYYVDGSPQAADIYTGSAWKTILVTGLREGGAAYFALDITDGEPMQNSTTVGAQFLWEFTDAELGETWGDAKTERITDGAGKTWGTFFGSGYADTDVAQASKQAYLYGVKSIDKSALWLDAASNPTNRVKLSATALTDDATSGVLVVDKDRISNYAADLLYAGNLYGDMYRFRNIGKGQAPIRTLLYESNNASHTQPIRATPSYAYAKYYKDFWVYFGTGRYELQVDKTSTSRQYFFGLLEQPDASNLYTTTYTAPANLATYTIDPDAINLLPTVAVPGTPQLAVLDSQVIEATVTYPDGTTSTRSFVTIKGKNTDKKPWVLRLDNSGAVAERSLNQPLVVAGVVFFTSFVPSNNPCAGNGKSYLYGVNYLTGEPVTKTVFDTNNDGVYDNQDNIYIDAGGNATIGTDDPTGKTMVPVAGIDLGAGQASNPVMEQGVIFVSTTDPGDDGGGGGGVDGGGIATPVDLEGMKANLGSWRDLSF